MDHQRSRDDTLRAMLLDILYEAELLRPYDPVKAAQLDDAANDLRLVMAEADRHGDVSPYGTVN